MSTPDSSSPFSQNVSNLRMYGAGDVARQYARTPDRLKPAEEAILQRLAESLRGRTLLDVGVGGGRTTPHLRALSQDYLGMDYSAGMVAACREKFPGVEFRECDARDMTSLGREKFDFILFSFNGIDSIDHAGRLLVLREVFALLKPGGRFLFSSHNRRLPVERPWHPRVYTWGVSPRLILYNLKCALRNTLNFLRHRGAQVHDGKYAILVDSQLEFRMKNYYIDPAEQVRQLEAQGFREVEIFDRLGQPRAADAPEVDATGHVHYLARKPSPAAS